MKRNEGSWDRVIRVVVAIVLGALALGQHGALAWVLWILAAISLVTAATGFCAIYALFGLRTCPARKS